MAALLPPRSTLASEASRTALIATAGKEKQLKGKILTLADRMLIRTMMVSVFVAAVVALGTSAQASRRPASAHATHRAALAVTTIKVIAGNSSFKLGARTAKRGIVIFKVTNKASFRHNFSIKGRTTRLLLDGQSANLRVTFLRMGRYPYKCTFDHHASWGQKGVFTIT